MFQQGHLGFTRSVARVSGCVGGRGAPMSSSDASDLVDSSDDDSSEQRTVQLSRASRDRSDPGDTKKQRSRAVLVKGTTTSTASSDASCTPKKRARLQKCGNERKSVGPRGKANIRSDKSPRTKSNTRGKLDAESDSFYINEGELKSSDEEKFESDRDEGENLRARRGHLRPGNKGKTKSVPPAESNTAKRERTRDGSALAAAAYSKQRGKKSTMRGGANGGAVPSEKNVARGRRAASSTPGAATAASSGDDEGCLTNSDSEVGGDHGRGGSADEPVRCRCGANDWEDGKSWIRCDGRDCWTWEHLRCAYPALSDDAAGQKTHLCLQCRKKGSGAGVRTLARGAGETTPERQTPPSTPPWLSSTGGRPEGSGFPGGNYDGEHAVRRSRRVAEIEGIRPLLARHNVVKEVLSSSDDDFGDADDALFDPLEGHAATAEPNGNGSDGESQFLAPEGAVEMSEEFRCRCGATREDEFWREKVQKGGGGGGSSLSAEGKSGGEDESHALRWVQCRSGSCGVWEHGACCDFGCAEVATAGKHWCRACDPKGKRHRKDEGKRRTNPLLRPQKNGSSDSGETSAGFKRKLGGKATKGRVRLNVQMEAILQDLWKAVAAGDIAMLETAFREAEEKGGEDWVRRLLGAQAPSSEQLGLHSLVSGDCEESAKVLTSPRKRRPKPLPSGLTLIMLAAGYWSMVGSNTDADSIRAAGDDEATPRVAPATTDEIDPAVDVGEGEAKQSSSTIESSTVEAVSQEPGRSSGGTAATSADRSETDGSTSPTASNDDADNRASAQFLSPPIIGATAAGSQERESRGTATEQKQELPLGSEVRLKVLRAVLQRWEDGARILAVDEDGRTAAHHVAAVNGAGEAEIILKGETNAEAAFVKDKKGLTPLQVAVSAGHADVFKAILTAVPFRRRAEALTATEDYSGDNALHMACAYGYTQCVEAILSEEAELQRDLSIGILKAAAGSGDRLSNFPSLNLARNSEGATPLMVAAACATPECLQVVLASFMKREVNTLGEKLDELRTVDDRGMNALHWVSEGSIVAAKALIAAERKLVRWRFPYLSNNTGRAGWDVRAMINSGDSENGASPLHLAAAVSHKEMVSCLLEAGANSVMLDSRGWTPVMYADFDGRKEGAILELLQHEPEKQLEALGNVLRTPDGRNQPRVIEVVRNLATTPAFFSLVNGFVRKNPGLLLSTLSFLREAPGLLDFENKRNLLRSLLETPDFITRTTLDAAAGVPYGGFGFDYTERIGIQRRPGQALGPLLKWMNISALRWSKNGLAAWLRMKQPSFEFRGEAGYGPGVDREAWELIAEDLVRAPFPPAPSHPATARSSPMASASITAPTPVQAPNVSSAETTQAITSPAQSRSTVDVYSGSHAPARGGRDTIDLSSSIIDHGNSSTAGINSTPRLSTLPGEASSGSAAPLRVTLVGGQQGQRQGVRSNSGNNGGDGNFSDGTAFSSRTRGMSTAAVDLMSEEDVEVVVVVGTSRPSATAGGMKAENDRKSESEAVGYFVTVDSGMSSYCPRDLVSDNRVGGADVGASRHGVKGKGTAAGGQEEDLRAFELIGVMIGANLGWNKVLNLNLNPIVWKAILSRKTSVADLELVDEMYHRSLTQVVEMNGVDQLGLSFGALDLEYCKGGGNVDPEQDVTDDNKELYASLALESRTFGRWRAQCYALSEGLRRLVPLRLLKMFTENELGLLLAGPGEIDVDDWQKHTVFSGRASAAIQRWFWTVVRSLTKEEKSLLLQFATGCSRLPAGGFTALSRPFTVVMTEYDSQRPLPMAATCFFMLKLPCYPDLYALRKSLLVAIRHGASGFEFS